MTPPTGDEASEGRVAAFRIHRRGTDGSGFDRSAPLATRSRTVAAAALALLGTALVACAPAPAPSIPACPARVDVQLEAPDPVHFSRARAVSPDGTWVALSRVIGDDVVFSARRAEAGTPSEVLGSIPNVDTNNRPPRVSVATDGSRVLWAGNIYAALPGSPTSPVFRWVRSTGVVETVDPPVATSPLPGTPYPTNLRHLSSDGARAIWSQSFYQGAGEFRHLRFVTDTGTDAVIAQYESETSSSNRFSIGGRSETTTWVGTAEHRVIDVDTNTSTSLTPALAAAQAAFPGGAFRPEISSDDGRFTVLQRPFETPATYVLWDDSAQEISLVDQGPGIRIDTVDDAGTVVYSVDTGATVRSVHHFADGTELIAADAPMQPSWPDDPPVGPLTSADRRTSVFSEPVPVLGNQLIARRCR